MAANPSSSTFLFAFLFLPAVLAITSLTDYNSSPSLVGKLPSLCPCNCPKENETRLHLYLHQLPAKPNVPNTNEVNVIMTPSSIGFGYMYIDDWFLTTGTDPNGKIVGRAHGFHIQAGQAVQRWLYSHIFEFQDDWFAGSSIQVVGLYSNLNGQWFITGGTGAFTNAHGTVKFSTSTSGTEAIYELNIHVFYTPEN